MCKRIGNFGKVVFEYTNVKRPSSIRMENKTNTSYNDRICKERLNDNAIFSSSSIDIIRKSIRFERFDNKWI